jgi:hypothetical protein
VPSPTPLPAGYCAAMANRDAEVVAELRRTGATRFRSWMESDAFESLWTYDDAGFHTRIQIYLDHQRAEAFEALGLKE